MQELIPYQKQVITLQLLNARYEQLHHTIKGFVGILSVSSLVSYRMWFSGLHFLRSWTKACSDIMSAMYKVALFQF